MKRIILALSILLALAFTACNHSQKQDEQKAIAKAWEDKNTAMIAAFKALTDKSMQLQATLENANDEDSAVKQEYDELQVEIANFVADNKESIAKLPSEQQAIFITTP